MAFDNNGFNMTAGKKPAIPTGSGRAFRVPRTPTPPSAPSIIGGSNSKYGVTPDQSSMGYAPAGMNMGAFSQKTISTPQNFNQNFFGQSPSRGIGQQDYGYDAYKVMENTLQGMRDLHPALNEVTFQMGKGLEPNYHPESMQLSLPHPQEFQQMIAQHVMTNPSLVNNIAQLSGVRPNQVTAPMAMSAIVRHEAGHAIDWMNQELSGNFDSYSRQDQQQRQRAMIGAIPYKDVHTEQMADQFATDAGATFRQYGYDPQTADIETSGNVILDRGDFFTQQGNSAAFNGFTPPSSVNGRTGMLRFLNDNASGGNMGRGGGMTINNAPGSVGGDQNNKNYSIENQDIASDKVLALNAFSKQGGSERFTSMVDQARGGFTSLAQAKAFKKANATYTKALGAVARHGTLSQRLTEGGIERLGDNAQEVGRMMTDNDAGMSVAGFDRDEVHGMAAQAQEFIDSHTPVRGGRSSGKSSGGGSSVKQVSEDLGELSKSIKEVVQGNKEQAKSSKDLTAKMESAKTNKPTSLNNPNLDMSQEERQGRLLQAISQGGVGGERARAKAMASGLYGSGGEEGDKGGLNYFGMNFKSQGAIDAIGGAIRLGNRASTVLHGMTHLSHNIINPLVGEIQQAGQTQINQGQMLYGIGGMSYSQFQQGQAGKAQRVLGGANLAKQIASQGVYNTYAGLAGALGSEAMGQYQGFAQSVASPALSTAVGMQAMGLGKYAGPLALAVGAGATIAYAEGQSSNRNGVSNALNQMYGSGHNGQVQNALSNFTVGWGSVFHSDVMKQGQEDAGLMMMFSKNDAQKMGPFQAGKNYSPSEQIDNVMKNYGNSSINPDGSVRTAVSRANAIQQQFNAYNKSGTAAGLTPEQVNTNFSFSSMYSPSQTGSYLRDTLDKINLGTGQDATQTITGATAARGSSSFDKGAMQTSTGGFLKALAESTLSGEAPSVFMARQNQQNQNAAGLNAALYENYGAGGPQIDPYKVDPRAGDTNYQRTRLGIEQSRAGARRSNMAAYAEEGYGIRAGIQQYAMIDNPAAVSVYQENEQTSLGLDRQMRGRGGKGIDTQNLLNINSMTQTQGDMFRNLMANDSWTTSVVNARKGGDAGLVTMDTNTGLRTGQYSMSQDYLSALQKNDKLGLLKGLSASDVAGGTAGIQRNMELKQRDMQMYQFTQQTQQQALQYNTTVGGGTLGANGMVQGGSLAGNASIYAQYGMKFNAGNGMTQWQVQDASTQLNRQQQVFSMNQGTQQMQMQVAQYNTAGTQYQENRQLQVAQFNYNTQYSREQMQIDRSHQVTQQGWQKQDLQYSRNMSELQFGFQMRDADRNIRYSRGRDRVDQMRQRDDAVILHAAEMGQKDKEEDRQKTQVKWADEQFKRDKEHFEKGIEFTKQQMDLDRKHWEENRKFELQSIQMSQAAHNMSMQMMVAQFKLEDQGRLLERQGTLIQMRMAEEATQKQQQLTVFMQQNQDKLNGIAQAQGVIDAQHIANLNTMKGVLDSMNQAQANVNNYVNTNHVNGGGASMGGYIIPPRGYADGGFTGYGDKTAPRGVVHGGEYVVPQNGTPVIRGDNQESLSVLKMIATILERIEKNPAVVNAVINTNQNNVGLKNLNLTDLAHGAIH